MVHLQVHHFRNRDHTFKHLISLNQVFFVFSKAMETIQQERFDEFGYTYVAPRWVIPTQPACTVQEQTKGLRLKLINTVPSGSTAKSWSCHSTTPSFSSTSASTLIGTPQMHVSHASLSLLFHLTHSPRLWCQLLHCLYCIHMSIMIPPGLGSNVIRNM